MIPSRDDLDSAERFVVAGILLATIAILGSAFRPPMCDASSHLATAVIAERIAAGDPFTSAHYVLDPIPVPYWLTVLELNALGFLDPHLAFKVLLAIHAILVPLSFWALARRFAPSAARFTPLVALTVFGSSFWSGETNFLFGQPFAVLAILAYLYARRVASLAFAAFLALAVVVYLGHVFVSSALLGTLLALAVASFALRRLGRPDDAPPFGPAQAALLAWTVALFGLAAYFVFAHHGTSANRGTLLFDLNPQRIGNVFEEPLGSPTILSPGPAFALALGIAAIWISSLPRDRTMSVAARLLAGIRPAFFFAGLAFAALLYLGPVGLLEAGGRMEEDISPRFAWIAFTLFLLSLRMELGVRRRQLLLVMFLAFGALKLADARSIHRRVGAAYETFTREVLAKIPEGSRVLAVNDRRDAGARRWTYFFLYAGNYAVVDRRAYVPTIFARAGQQALRHTVRGEHRGIFDRTITGDEWDYYDFVLVQTESESPKIEGLAERTSETAAAAGFRLYRILRPVSWGDAEAPEPFERAGSG